MKYLLLLLMIVVIPAYADPLENLNKAIESDGFTYNFSEHFEVRQFKDSNFVKLQGLTTTGEHYFIYTNELTGFEKVILYDGEWRKGTLISKPIQAQNVPIVKDETVQMFVRVDSVAQIQKELSIDVKVTDTSINAGLLSKHGIEGADVIVKVSQDGQLLRTLEGKTGKTGIFNTSTFITDGVFEHDEYLDVEVRINYKDQQIVENYKTWLILKH